MSTNDTSKPGSGRTKKSSGPTIAGVKQQVDGLSSRYDADIKSVTTRLGGHDQKHKLADKRHTQITRVVAQLGERVAADHDSVVADLTPRLVHLEELVRDGIKFESALKLSDFTNEEIREILSIQDEDDLTTSAVVAAIINSIGSVKVQLNQVIDTLADTRGIVNEHTARFDTIDGPEGLIVSLRKRVDADLNELGAHVDTRLTRFNSRINGLHIKHSLPGGAWLVALVAFLVPWLVIWQVGNNLSGNVHGTGANANKVVGTWNAQLHFGWIGFFIGIIAAGLVLHMFRRAELRTSVEETTVTTTRNNTAATASTRANPAPSQPQKVQADTPTQVLTPVKAQQPQPQRTS